ncbi:hypothetical protein OGAPHI_006469 [Ogataea philodendri]|uniref:Uncharacterized protein n=1 Tax=Ogataea philodendri TaxID=1378263 RepID=A0A9P8NXK1_9ASCO|nr:uncharacterized protein OGAPHI_006469 [Ogataea philodendri]KAH3661620.1 hypothetical protein OGAPHI_006469 [Ogataea philodendri]
MRSTSANHLAVSIQWAHSPPRTRSTDELSSGRSSAEATYTSVGVVICSAAFLDLSTITEDTSVAITFLNSGASGTKTWPVPHPTSNNVPNWLPSVAKWYFRISSNKLRGYCGRNWLYWPASNFLWEKADITYITLKLRGKFF